MLVLFERSFGFNLEQVLVYYFDQPSSLVVELIGSFSVLVSTIR
jgi:hypothetical protein